MTITYIILIQVLLLLGQVYAEVKGYKNLSTALLCAVWTLAGIAMTADLPNF